MLEKMRDTMRAMTVEDVVNLEANFAAQLTSEQREELERMVEELMRMAVLRGVILRWRGCRARGSPRESCL